MVQILLIHNEFNCLDISTYLSYGIRVVTCSKWNHVAIRIEDEVYEAIGKGVIVTPYSEWSVYKNRQVLPLIPNKDVILDIESVKNAKDKPYGFLDLVDRFNQIREERWNGKIHIPKEHKGLICSDLACILLGIPCKYMPSDFENKYYEFNLTKQAEYRTYKK